MPVRYNFYVSCIREEFEIFWPEISSEIKKISPPDYITFFYAKVDKADISHAKTTLENFCQQNGITFTEHIWVYEMQTNTFCNRSYWTFGSKSVNDETIRYQSPTKNFYYVGMPT